MPWGYFEAQEKGPYVFKVIDWSKITAESYCEHILPHQVNWMRASIEQRNCCLNCMHDNVLSHTADRSIEYLNKKRH